MIDTKEIMQDKSGILPKVYLRPLSSLATPITIQIPIKDSAKFTKTFGEGSAI